MVEWRHSRFFVENWAIIDVNDYRFPPFVAKRMLHRSLLRCDSILIALLDRPLLHHSHVIDDGRVFLIIRMDPCLIKRRD